MELSSDKKETYWMKIAAACQMRDFGMLWRNTWALYYQYHPEKARKNQNDNKTS